MIQLKKRDERPFRLRPSKKGRHQFGGHCSFEGIVPDGCDVPLHQLLLIDLTDPAVPLEPTNLCSLPLLYPLKYGGGGAELQYSIQTSNRIEILYMSDPLPDPPGQQYVKVPSLPIQRLDLVPFSYSEAKFDLFKRDDTYFRTSWFDSWWFKEIYTTRLIYFGGFRYHIPNAGPRICHNPACENFNCVTACDFLASLPPVKVDGNDDFWYEFRGAFMDFVFLTCSSCRTIITFNIV